MKRTLLAVALVLVTASLVAASTVEDYGFVPADLKDTFLASLRGYWDAPHVPDAVRTLTPGQRAAVVQALGAFAKAYVASTDFNKDYKEMRKNAEGGKRGFGMPSLGGLKKKAEDAVKAKATGESGPVETSLEKDPNAQLRKRLQAFLDASAEVDFEAQLQGTGSYRTFVKPEYESRPPVWKMCFRAGPEATQAARSFAEAWIKELPPEK